MQIKRIEKEIRDTPYHKATEHHIGRLRAKLSKLKDSLLTSSSKKGGGGSGYAVKKQGDATIVLVGPPSAGKSTLLNQLTNAKSRIAPYAFTTVSVVPGMMYYNEARIQVLDVPGLIEGAEEGKGRGKEVLSVARAADFVVLMTDVKRPHVIKSITDALTKNGVRLNQNPPNVSIEKKLRGGIIVHSNIKQDISKETIKEIVSEMGFKNAEVTLKEKVTIDTLVDALTPSRVYVPSITLVNKSDLKSKKDSNKSITEALYISAEKGQGLDKLKETIWDSLNFVTVYLVRPNEKPNKNHPLVAKKEMELNQIASIIGEEFSEGKTKAKIWGPGAKYPGQGVSLTKKIEEGMQIRFV